MAKFGKFIMGFFMGSLLGGAAALLFTPYSGENLRIEANQYIKKTQADIRLAAENKRVELEAQLNKLRAPQKPETEEEA